MSLPSDGRFVFQKLDRPRPIGRSERIRTSDPLLPKQVRYQTALHSVLGSGRLIDMLFGLGKHCSGGYTGPSAGASPSGKAADFDSAIRRFDPSRPSQSP